MAVPRINIPGQISGVGIGFTGITLVYTPLSDTRAGDEIQQIISDLGLADIGGSHSIAASPAGGGTLELQLGHEDPTRILTAAQRLSGIDLSEIEL